MNKAYAWYPRRHKSDEYKAWEIEAEKAIKQQESFEIEGDEWLSAMYILRIDLHCKNGQKKKIDVANYEKLTSDFLAHHIPWFADHKILSNTQVKKQKDPWAERTIEIYIEEIEAPL